MGLDNGLLIKTKKIIPEDSVPDYVELAGFYSTPDGTTWAYEVCYWRKCWNIRNMILEVLDAPGSGGGYYDVNPKQLVQIRDGIYHFLTDGDQWDDEGASIWDFKDMIPTLAQNIVDITWALDYLKEHPYAYVQFYDSY